MRLKAGDWVRVNGDKGPGLQSTSAGEREVRKALRKTLRKTLFDFRLHQDAELFEKAYGYVKQYY